MFKVTQILNSLSGIGTQVYMTSSSVLITLPWGHEYVEGRYRFIKCSGWVFKREIVFSYWYVLCMLRGAIRESLLKVVAFYWPLFISTKCFVLGAGDTK